MAGYNPINLLYVTMMSGSCVAEIVASTGLPILQSFMSGINAFEDFALGALIQGESPVYSLDFIGYIGFFVILGSWYYFKDTTENWLFGYCLWKFVRALNLHCAHFHENEIQFGQDHLVWNQTNNFTLFKLKA